MQTLGTTSALSTEFRELLANVGLVAPLEKEAAQKKKGKDGKAALNETNRFTAMSRLDYFSHQNCARGPLAPKAKAL